jgi:hypothetical protein
MHASGTRLPRLVVRLRNCGDVVVDPGTSYTKIQVPPNALPSAQALAETSWFELATILHPWAGDGTIIEPGESESYCHDVPLPDGIRYVQISSVVKCDEDGRLHWDETTLIDLFALDPSPQKEIATDSGALA